MTAWCEFFHIDDILYLKKKNSQEIFQNIDIFFKCSHTYISHTKGNRNADEVCSLSELKSCNDNDITRSRGADT